MLANQKELSAIISCYFEMQHLSAQIDIYKKLKELPKLDQLQNKLIFSLIKHALLSDDIKLLLSILELKSPSAKLEQNMISTLAASTAIFLGKLDLKDIPCATFLDLANKFNEISSSTSNQSISKAQKQLIYSVYQKLFSSFHSTKDSRLILDHLKQIDSIYPSISNALLEDVFFENHVLSYFQKVFFNKDEMPLFFWNNYSSRLIFDTQISILQKFGTAIFANIDTDGDLVNFQERTLPIGEFFLYYVSEIDQNKFAIFDEIEKKISTLTSIPTQQHKACALFLFLCLLYEKENAHDRLDAIIDKMQQLLTPDVFAKQMLDIFLDCSISKYKIKEETGDLPPILYTQVINKENLQQTYTYTYTYDGLHQFIKPKLTEKLLYHIIDVTIRLNDAQTLLNALWYSSEPPIPNKDAFIDNFKNFIIQLDPEKCSFKDFFPLINWTRKILNNLGMKLEGDFCFDEIKIYLSKNSKKEMFQILLREEKTPKRSFTFFALEINPEKILIENCKIFLINEFSSNIFEEIVEEENISNLYLKTEAIIQFLQCKKKHLTFDIPQITFAITEKLELLNAKIPLAQDDRIKIYILLHVLLSLLSLDKKNEIKDLNIEKFMPIINEFKTIDLTNKLHSQVLINLAKFVSHDHFKLKLIIFLKPVFESLSLTEQKSIKYLLFCIHTDEILQSLKELPSFEENLSAILEIFEEKDLLNSLTTCFPYQFIEGYIKYRQLHINSIIDLSKENPGVFDPLKQSLISSYLNSLSAYLEMKRDVELPILKELISTVNMITDSHLLRPLCAEILKLHEKITESIHLSTQNILAVNFEEISCQLFSICSTDLAQITKKISAQLIRSSNFLSNKDTITTVKTNILESMIQVITFNPNARNFLAIDNWVKTLLSKLSEETIESLSEFTNSIASKIASNEIDLVTLQVLILLTCNVFSGCKTPSKKDSMKGLLTSIDIIIQNTFVKKLLFRGSKKAHKL